ncbi:reverse transcriptase domain-containing protein [Tanacetum coccineum]
MVVRNMKQRYYWSSMHRDAAKVIQDCEKCKEQSVIRKIAESSAVTQSFTPITEHMEIMKHIKKQLARSQQGWVDDLAQVLWVHATLKDQIITYMVTFIQPGKTRASQQLEQDLPPIEWKEASSTNKTSTEPRGTATKSDNQGKVKVARSILA